MFRSILFLPLLFASFFAKAQDNAVLAAARLHYSKAQYTNALTVLDAITEHNNTDFNAWLLKGDCFQKEGKYTEAIQCYAVAEKLDNTAAILYANWAAALYNLKQFENGEKKAKIALKLDYDLPEAQYFMGNIKHNDYSLLAALKHYNQAIKHNPDYRDALYMRAATHGELKNYHEAIRDYKKVLELDPNMEIAKYNIAVIQLTTESYTAAAETFAGLDPKKLESPNDYYFYMAESLYFAGNKDEACALYEKAKDMGDEESAKIYQKYCLDKEDREKQAPTTRTIRATF